MNDLRRIDRIQAQRILKKLDFYIQQKSPLRFAKRLSDSRLGMYRFRVGFYRIIFDTQSAGNLTKLVILYIGHRREIYK